MLLFLAEKSQFQIPQLGKSLLVPKIHTYGVTVIGVGSLSF